MKCRRRTEAEKQEILRRCEERYSLEEQRQRAAEALRDRMEGPDWRHTRGLLREYNLAYERCRIAGRGIHYPDWETYRKERKALEAIAPVALPEVLGREDRPILTEVDARLLLG